MGGRLGGGIHPITDGRPTRKRPLTLRLVGLGCAAVGLFFSFDAFQTLACLVQGIGFAAVVTANSLEGPLSLLDLRGNPIPLCLGQFDLGGQDGLPAESGRSGPETLLSKLPVGLQPVASGRNAGGGGRFLVLHGLSSVWAGL